MSSSKLGHLLVFDLSKIGAAYQIINEFVDDISVSVFEVSPVADRAVVMLITQDLISAQVIFSQARTLFHNDILQSALIESIDENVISVYLSQKQAPTAKNYMVVESNFFAAAFNHASAMSKAGLALVDFRAIRTNPANLILIYTSDAIDQLNELSIRNAGVRTTLIENVKPALKSYFEILK